MAKVEKLTIAPRPVNGDVVDLLEQTLMRARLGEVFGVAVVEVGVAGEVSTNWHHRDCYHRLNSGCARLAAKIASIPDDE